MPVQHPQLRTCRFYMGELLMSVLALSAATYGMAAVNRWSFSVFLTLQGILLSPFLVRISVDAAQ